MFKDIGERTEKVFHIISRSFPLTMLTGIFILLAVVGLSTLIHYDNTNKPLYQYRVILVPDPKPIEIDLTKVTRVNYVWAGQYRTSNDGAWETVVYAPEEDQAMNEMETILNKQLKSDQTSKRVFKAEVVKVDAIRVEKTYIRD